MIPFLHHHMSAGRQEDELSRDTALPAGYKRFIWICIEETIK